MTKQLRLGVELEVEVKGNPNAKTTHTSDYIIQGSYPKHNNLGHTHAKNGNMVKIVDTLTGDKIKTYYDNTVSGFEWVGDPLTFKGNVDLWLKVLEHPEIAPYIHGEDVKVTEHTYGSHDCGMHVHVSGDQITPQVLGKLLEFVNTTDNKSFIEFMAGRAFNRFCSTFPWLTATKALDFYHSDDCKKISKRGQKVEMTLSGAYDYSVPSGYCCNKAVKVAQMGMVRGAIWPFPYVGTGDYEIRFFKSTVRPERFITNLEFCVAMVDFCMETKTLSYKDFNKWMSDHTEFPYLFKFLRKEGYVKGLIRPKAKAA